MPTRAEIELALWGTWLLLRQDPRALECFDFTVEGFWKSFFAAVVALPFYAFLVLHELVLVQPTSPALAVLARLVGYALDWVAFAVAAALLLRMLGLGRRFVPLVVMVNWAAVPQLALMAGAVVASLVLPDVLDPLLLVAALVAVLFYRWLVVRQALEGLGGIAFGFVVVDVLLGILVDRLVGALFSSG